MLEVLYYILGIFTGIVFTLIAILFGKKNPYFVEKLEGKILKKTAYFAGSDTEKFPEDEEVKIQ